MDKLSATNGALHQQNRTLKRKLPSEQKSPERNDEFLDAEAKVQPLLGYLGNNFKIYLDPQYQLTPKQRSIKKQRRASSISSVMDTPNYSSMFILQTSQQQKQQQQHQHAHTLQEREQGSTQLHQDGKNTWPSSDAPATVGDSVSGTAGNTYFACLIGNANGLMLMQHLLKNTSCPLGAIDNVLSFQQREELVEHILNCQQARNCTVEHCHLMNLILRHLRRTQYS